MERAPKPSKICFFYLDSLKIGSCPASSELALGETTQKRVPPAREHGYGPERVGADFTTAVDARE